MPEIKIHGVMFESDRFDDLKVNEMKEFFKSLNYPEFVKIYKRDKYLKKKGKQHILKFLSSARIISSSLNYDGTRIVTSSKTQGGFNDGIRLWDVDTDKCILTLKNLSMGIYHDVIFNHDGTKIAFTADCAILVWNVD